MPEDCASFGPENGKVLPYVLGYLRASQSGDQLGRFRNSIIVLYSSVNLLKSIVIILNMPLLFIIYAPVKLLRRIVN